MTGSLVFSQLDKSQIKYSNAYFEAIAGMPHYLKVLNQLVDELELEANNLSSSRIKNDSLRVAKLVKSIEEFENQLNFSDSLQYVAQTMDTYIRGYYYQFPNGFSIYKAVQGTTSAVGSFFGLGGLINGLLPKTLNINSTRKKKVRNYILSFHKNVVKCLETLNHVLEVEYAGRIKTVEDKYTEDIKLILLESNSTSSLEHYTSYNPTIIEFYSKLYTCRKLLRELEAATKEIKDVQNHLYESFQQKEDITENSQDVRRLRNAISKIEGTIKQLQL
ncbi:MAG: hypothetical protein Tsb0034_15430 [Ekhidna sp.]